MRQGRGRKNGIFQRQQQNNFIHICAIERVCGKSLQK